MKVWDFLEGEKSAVVVASSDAKDAAEDYGIEQLDECGCDYIDIVTRDDAGTFKKFRVHAKTEYTISKVRT